MQQPHSHFTDGLDAVEFGTAVTTLSKVGGVGGSAGISYGDPGVTPMEAGGNSTAAPSGEIAQEIGESIIAELDRTNPENAARIGLADAQQAIGHLP